MNVKAVVAMIAAIIVIAAVTVYYVDHRSDEPSDDFSGIIYDGNGGFNENNKATWKGDEGKYNVTPDIPHRDGYKFDRWSTEKDGEGDTYHSGDEVEHSGRTVTLYAQWDSTPVKAEFKSNLNPDTIPGLTVTILLNGSPIDPDMETINYGSNTIRIEFAGEPTEDDEDFTLVISKTENSNEFVFEYNGTSYSITINVSNASSQDRGSCGNAYINYPFNVDVDVVITLTLKTL